MYTGMSGSYQWIAITDRRPGAFLPVLLARLSPERDNGEVPEANFVQPGYWDGEGWRSDYDGPVADVTHWTAFPSPPARDQMRKVLDELS